MILPKIVFSGPKFNIQTIQFIIKDIILLNFGRISAFIVISKHPVAISLQTQALKKRKTLMKYVLRLIN